MQTEADPILTLNQHLNFDLLTSVSVHAYGVSWAIYFVVDSSSRFPFKARTNSYRLTELITLPPTPAWVTRKTIHS